jgi:hypothetical protein
MKVLANIRRLHQVEEIVNHAIKAVKIAVVQIKINAQNAVTK